MPSIEFSLFAEYFQFYVQDSETDDTLPVHWEPEDEDAMALVSDEIIAVRTVRETDVPIALEAVAAKPEDEDELDSWDHVIECALRLPSGALLLTATSEDVYESQLLPLEEGVYGVRIYYGMLDAIEPEGFEGDDHYRICVWKVDKDEDPPVFRILKQWEPDATHHLH